MLAAGQASVGKDLFKKNKSHSTENIQVEEEP